MLRCICLGCWLAGLVVAGGFSAHSATIQTLDGQRHEGGVRLTNGHLLVTATSGAVTAVAFTNLQQAKFGAAAGSAPPAATGTGTGFLGVYYGKTNFDGNVVVRLDQSVNFDWGEGEPAPGIEKDYFGVIWMAEVEAPASGEFTFTLATDDGGRLFVNNKLLAESWQRQEAAEVSGAIALEAGQRYSLKLMYFDFVGNARARLSWSGPGTPKGVIPRERLHAKSFLDDHAADIRPGQGVLATFYKNSDFTGDTFSRVETNIDWHWSGDGPPPAGRSTNFSVRWTGQAQADFSETYTFHLQSDEGARLWVDGQLLINQWRDGGQTEFKESVALNASQKYDLRLETRNTGGGASAKLLWSSPSTPKAVVPQDHLWPAFPPGPRDASAGPGEGALPGVWLRNGAFLAGPVVSATPTAVKVSGLFKDNAVSTVNIARLIFQPLSPAMTARLPSGRAGLLLAKGDFIDGEFRGLEDQQVKLSSILLGARSYDARKEVLAAVLRDVSPGPAAFAVHLRDQSVLLVNALNAEQDRLLVPEPALGPLKIPAGELDLIQRRAAPAK